MQKASRILVLFNLALSFSFLGIAIHTYVHRLELPDELRNQKQIVADLTKWESDLNAKKSKLETRVRDLTTDFGKAKKNTTTVVANLTKQMNELNADMKRSRDEATDLTNKTTESLKQQADLRTKVRGLEADRDAAKKRLAELEKKQFDLSNELAQTESVLGIAKSRESGLSARLNEKDSASAPELKTTSR